MVTYYDENLRLMRELSTDLNVINELAHCGNEVWHKVANMADYLHLLAETTEIKWHPIKRSRARATVWQVNTSSLRNVVDQTARLKVSLGNEYCSAVDMLRLVVETSEVLHYHPFLQQVSGLVRD